MSSYCEWSFGLVFHFKWKVKDLWGPSAVVLSLSACTSFLPASALIFLSPLVHSHYPKIVTSLCGFSKPRALWVLLVFCSMTTSTCPHCVDVPQDSVLLYLHLPAVSGSKYQLHNPKFLSPVWTSLGFQVYIINISTWMFNQHLRMIIPDLFPQTVLPPQCCLS